MTMNADQIKAASVQELNQWMANALTTSNCIGHMKSEQNERLAAVYRAELILRGVDVPTINFSECIAADNFEGREKAREGGVYNGQGSF
jgi:hypothetical protein